MLLEVWLRLKVAAYFQCLLTIVKQQWNFCENAWSDPGRLEKGQSLRKGGGSIHETIDRSV